MSNLRVNLHVSFQSEAHGGTGERWEMHKVALARVSDDCVLFEKLTFRYIKTLKRARQKKPSTDILNKGASVKTFFFYNTQICLFTLKLPFLPCTTLSRQASRTGKYNQY